MEFVYKFALLKNDNEISKIYVFYGSEQDEASLDIYKDNEVIKNIFTKKELDIIREKKINVTFIKSSIYPDDTIEVIKEKLLQFCGLECSFEEIYLFAQQIEHVNALSLFKNITQNEKLDLTKERFIQYLLNIDNDKIDINKLEDKQLYTYDDIVLLGLDNIDVLITLPIGQKFVALDKSIIYTVNPFSVLSYDTFLEKYAQDITSTTNKNILMNIGDGKIHNNMIYICLSEDVLKYTITLGLSQESTIKIYFPYLHQKNILNLDQLEERKQALLVESEGLINDSFEKTNEAVSVYYNIYKERLDELTYIEQGTRDIEFIIHPEIDFNLPLDIVFKLIHATREVPLIKYNPAKKQDKLYRLYTDKVATNGKKIPYLDKSLIFRLVKTIGKTKRVSVYIEYREKDNISPIICDFEHNGSIHVSGKFSKANSIELLNTMLKESINPVIDVVKNYLSQNGYSINLFNNLNEPNIEIVNMDYIIYTPVNKVIKLTPIMGCVSSVFNVMSDDMKNGITMRFKRVANYNEMDSIDAFITEMLNREYNESDIIDLLISNYNMTPKKAQTKLAEFISSLQVVQDAFQNRKLKNKNSPGFLTTISQEQFNKNIIITISGINNMSYLNTLPIYIDSFIRLTQKQTGEVKNYEKECKAIVSTEPVTQVEDIVSTAELVNTDNKQMNIVAQELVFENIEEIGGEADKGEDMFDYFFGNEEEEDVEEGGEKEEEVDILDGGALAEIDGGALAEIDGGAGGLPKKPKKVEETSELDITGKRLTHPNPFHDRISKRDPNLFITYKDENFKDYSRSCPWNYRRHPVILTDDEKEKIDKEHPGSYDKESAVKYGSDKDKKFWYICPRYWSLKDNTSLTDEEVASGNYGKVIPHDGKKVGKGEAIFEFNDSVYHKGKKGEYVNLHPGFLKPNSQGKCLPCCFSDWKSSEQQKRRDTCALDEVPVPVQVQVPVPVPVQEEPSIKEPSIMKEPTIKEPKKKTNVTDDYIKGSDKYPLEHNRYGFLPIPIQRFLMTDNKKCQISISNTNLKPDHICMVRRGVEFSKSQSFIACIADIYSGINNVPQQSIIAFKETLINAMDIDTFLSLQNGNLINIFAQDELIDISNVIDLKEFENSILYKTSTTTKNAKKHDNVFIKIAHAFNNFKEYLRDTTIEIDYIYLWDLICQPNNKLFKNGLNMAIVEMNNNDITSNISIVCPSNHYSSTFFDDYKDTVIIIKHSKQFDNKTYNLYEPIYAIEDRKKHYDVTYGFKLNSLVNINETIEIIKRSFTKCGTYPSMPKVYEFTRNISLEKMIDLLDIKSYTVEKQVMNFNGKIIGVVVNRRKSKKGISKGFLPCYPSAFIKHIDTGFIWMDDNYSDTYKNTLAFLNTVYKDFNGRIPCKPKIKVVEDELIVGIITETNQFIMISEPVADTFGEDLLKNDDMGIVKLDDGKIDRETLVDIRSESIRSEEADTSEADTSEADTSEAVDNERVTYINNIRIESKVYSVFRSIARILLGQMRYRNIKEEIEKLIGSTSVLYLNKLKQVDELLRKLMRNSVEFSKYGKTLVTDIVNCNTLNKDQCVSNKFCLEKSDGSCALIISKLNLVNGLDNEVVYFSKLADELIRYNRIKSFIFQQNVFLSFTSVKYNLNDNEIILLQSLLTNEYFDGLIISQVNKYIKNNTYDTAQPLKTITYSNTVDAFKEVEPKESARKEVERKTNCDEPGSILITSPYWKNIFPENSIEIIFHDSPALCTFDILLVILKNSKLSKSDLKEILIDEYLHYYAEYKFEIIQILKLQGKRKIADQLILNKTTLSDIIMNENYYTTNMDIWLLAKHYKLPLIFLSSTELLENNSKFLVANYLPNNDNYYFIRTPGIKLDVPNVYRLVAAPEYKDKIPLSALNADVAKNITESINENALEDYLHRVSLLDTTMRLKNKKVKLVVEEETEEPEKEKEKEPSDKVKAPKKLKKKIVLEE